MGKMRKTRETEDCKIRLCRAGKICIGLWQWNLRGRCTVRKSMWKFKALVKNYQLLSQKWRWWLENGRQERPIPWGPSLKTTQTSVDFTSIHNWVWRSREKDQISVSEKQFWGQYAEWLRGVLEVGTMVAASASPGSLLESQHLRPHNGFTETSICILIRVPRFVCIYSMGGAPLEDKR